MSAEVRLWWRSRRRGDVEDWFEGLSGLRPGGGGIREDVYVRDEGQVELGVKVRAFGSAQQRLEVKSLIGMRGDVPPFGPVIRTRKPRRLRKYGWNGASLAEIELDEEENVRDGGKPEAGATSNSRRWEWWDRKTAGGLVVYKT